MALLAGRGRPADAVLAAGDHEAGGVKVELLELKRERTGAIDPYRLSLESYLLNEDKRIKYALSVDTN